jgi:hypothetical protein
MEIQIHCAHHRLLPISELKSKFHPDNPNTHSDAQIERLARIFEYQGVRKPAVISKRSDRLTAGHGRVLAAEKAGMTEYPVDYQDYETEEHEYSDLCADNAVGAWSELNFSFINAKLPDLGPDFDIDMLGIKDFKLDPSEIPEVDEPKKNSEIECPACGEVFAK